MYLEWVAFRAEHQGIIEARLLTPQEEKDVIFW